MVSSLGAPTVPLQSLLPWYHHTTLGASGALSAAVSEPVWPPAWQKPRAFASRVFLLFSPPQTPGPGFCLACHCFPMPSPDHLHSHRRKKVTHGQVPCLPSLSPDLPRAASASQKEEALPMGAGSGANHSCLFSSI